MSTPPDSWVVTYQHGYTIPEAIGGSVIVAGPAVFNLLGDLDPFDLGQWTKNCHPDDLGAVVEANMYSNDRKEPFDQVIRMEVNGEWKWIRACSRSIGIDNQGNHRFSGVLMDYTGFLPDDLQVVIVETDEETSKE